LPLALIITGISLLVATATILKPVILPGSTSTEINSTEA
jgi:hypothetical protein